MPPPREEGEDCSRGAALLYLFRFGFRGLGDDEDERTTVFLLNLGEKEIRKPSSEAEDAAALALRLGDMRPEGMTGISADDSWLLDISNGFALPHMTQKFFRCCLVVAESYKLLAVALPP